MASSNAVLSKLANAESFESKLKNSDNLESSRSSENIKKSTNNNTAAEKFRSQLYSLLETKPPISKEKMDQITKEAISSVRNYKHIVYYVETFIKNCSGKYKIPGLYVIDAIIRNNSKSENSSVKKSKDLYQKRFCKNMCKTFTNIYNKCPLADREKITKVLQLWQKYKIIDSDLFEKLTRISEAAKLEMAISSGSLNLNTSNVSSLNDLDTSLRQMETDALRKNESREYKEKSKSNRLKSKLKRAESDKLKKLKHLQGKLSKHQKIINSETASQSEKANSTLISNNLIADIHKLTSKMLNSSTTNNSLVTENDNKKPISSPVTTKNEISQLLDHDSDLDSDNSNKNKSTKRASLKPNEEDGSILNSSSSDKFNNCAAWIQSTMSSSNEENTPKKIKTIHLPDLSQPPPPLLVNYKSLAAAPPPPPPPPPPTSLSSIFPQPVPSPYKNDPNKLIDKEKSRERSTQGLPNIRENHICICSKTLWLGHLAKLTTEDSIIQMLIDLLDDRRKSSSSSSNKQLTRTSLIVDFNLIPPRGCAYVEFVDRKLASKCLDRMKDGGYKLDGNSIKVAWATNKGINKERRIKQYWNVEVGCTYVPWTELSETTASDLIKWSEGGLLDKDSIPKTHLESYEQQLIQNEKLKNEKQQANVPPGKSDEHDMDLDTEEEVNPSNGNANPNGVSIDPQTSYPGLINPGQMLGLPNMMSMGSNPQYQFMQAQHPTGINFVGGGFNPINANPNNNSSASTQPLPVPPPINLNHMNNAQLQLLAASQHQHSHHHLQQQHMQFAHHFHQVNSNKDNGDANATSMNNEEKMTNEMLMSTNDLNKSANGNDQNQLLMNMQQQQQQLNNSNLNHPSHLMNGPSSNPPSHPALIQIQQPFADLLNNHFNSIQRHQQQHTNLAQHFQLVQRPLMSMPAGIRAQHPAPGIPIAVNPGLFRHIGLMQPLPQLVSNQDQHQLDLNETTKSSNNHLLNLMNQSASHHASNPPQIRNLNSMMPYHLNPTHLVNLNNQLQINGNNQNSNNRNSFIDHDLSQKIENKVDGEETGASSTNIKPLMDMSFNPGANAKFEPPAASAFNSKSGQEETDHTRLNYESGNKESSFNDSRNSSSGKSKYSSWRQHSTSPSSRRSSDRYSHHSYSSGSYESSKYDNSRNENSSSSKRYSGYINTPNHRSSGKANGNNSNDNGRYNGSLSKSSDIESSSGAERK